MNSALSYDRGGRLQTASGLLGYYHGLETAGTLTRDQAQQQAMDAIRGLRYNKTDYFWINDLRPVMIMHPANPKLVGQDLSTIKDPDGFQVSHRRSAQGHCRGDGEYRQRGK